MSTSLPVHVQAVGILKRLLCFVPATSCYATSILCRVGISLVFVAAAPALGRSALIRLPGSER